MYNIDDIKAFTYQIFISTVVAILVLLGCIFYFERYNTNIYKVSFQLVSKSYMHNLSEKDRVNDLLDYEIRLKNLNNNNYALNSLLYSNEFKKWDYSTTQYKNINTVLSEMNKLLIITINKLIKEDEKSLKLMEDLYEKDLQKYSNYQNYKNVKNNKNMYIFVTDGDTIIKNQILQLKSKVNLLKTYPFAVKTTVSELKKNIITHISKSLTIAFIFFILSNFIIFFISRMRN